MIKKIWKIVFLLLASLMLISVILIGRLFILANITSKQITLSAPFGPVIIQRDQFNVPHIQAQQADTDAFFALGYVHAQDRLWQMEFQRRVASGTLSEIFGIKTIKQDEFLRTWGFYHAAEQALVALDPASRQIVHAYTQGVNAYLAKGPLPIPFYILRFHPKPWTDVDSIAWQKMMAWNLDNGWQRKIKNALIANVVGKNSITKLFPPYPKDAPTILSDRDVLDVKLISDSAMNKQGANPQDTPASNALRQHLAMATTVRRELGFKDSEGKGSNAWVVSGKLTTTGLPILANDVHLQLSSPALWYLAELKGPNLHVTGGTIPGLPLVAIGHNDFIAWGVTHSYADTQDLYIEDKNTPVTMHQEVIQIKGAKPEVLQVLVSEHGPIISTVSDAGKVSAMIAIKWPALQPGDTTVSSFVKINYARNWNDFVNALALYVSPPQNFLYADIKGNIGYYLAGKIPQRVGWVGTFPISKNENKEWQGYIPFTRLPHSYNPPEGYIAAANNKIVSDRYPYSLTFRWNVPPYRIARINDVIRSEKVTVQNTMALQTDTESYIWRALRPRLLRVTPLDAVSKRALTILSLWNGRFDLDSEGASVFAYWYQTLLQSATMVDDKLGQFDPLFIVQSLSKNVCYSSYTTKTDCAAYLSNTLQLSIQKLNTEHQQDRRWGAVHQAVFEEFALGKVKALGWIWNRNQAAPGGDFTVNVGTYDPVTMNQLNGAVYRQIIDLANFNNSFFVIPLGQQDNPLSLHYNDQLPLWLSGKYVPMSWL